MSQSVRITVTGKPAATRHRVRTRRREDDTPILPFSVAASVIQEASRHVDTPFPAYYVEWLAEKAEACHARNERFRRKLRGQGNAGRDWLHVFMRHWLSALLRYARQDPLVLFPCEWNPGRPLNGVATGRRLQHVGCLPRPGRWPPRAAVNPLLSRGRRPSVRITRRTPPARRPAATSPSRGSGVPS